VGAHWSCIVARPPRRRCWRSLPVEVTTWSVSHVSRARLATRVAYARVCRPTLHAPDWRYAPLIPASLVRKCSGKRPGLPRLAPAGDAGRYAARAVSLKKGGRESNLVVRSAEYVCLQIRKGASYVHRKGHRGAGRGR
jgi:hypothetical protein